MKVHDLSSMAANTGMLISGLVLAVSTTVKPNPILASLSTGSLAGTFLLTRKADKCSKIADLEARIEQYKTAGRSSVELATQLQYDLDMATNRLKVQVPALQESLDRAEATIAELNEVKTLLENNHRDSTHRILELETLTESQKQTIEEHKQNTAKWSAQFDQMTQDYENRLEAAKGSVTELTMELNKYQFSNATIVENEKLKVSQEVSKLRDTLRDLEQTNGNLTQSREALAAHVREGLETIQNLQNEFQWLSGDGFSEVEMMHKQALSALDSELVRLQAENITLRQPQKFDVPGEYSRADKLIDLLYHAEESLTLDASEICPEPDGGAFTLYLNLRDRKARGTALIEHLDAAGEALMMALGCIEPLKWSFDKQNPHRIQTKLRYRKVKKSEKDISKLWKSADQFITIAGKWSRVRIVGGSESGKSPLAEMVAGAMQKVKGNVELRLAFPLEGSQKNNWGIPVWYQGWAGVKDAAGDLVARAEARESGLDKTKHFVATIIDECDTALEHDKDLASEVKAVLKAGSHSNIGLIFCGQNANVKQWRGFDRSDFENCVNVYIGSSCLHGISNSHLSEDIKTKAKATADTLIAHLETQNEGIEDPADLTRFAMVVEPSKSPYFIQLPPFGSIAFDNSKMVDTGIQTVKPEPTSCPDCGTLSIRKHGKDKEGKQRFRCLNNECETKTFTV